MAEISSSSASRLQLTALVVLGGLLLLGGILSEILSHFQALEFLQKHWPPLYTFFMSEKTHVVLMLVGMGMLGVAIWKLFQKPNSAAKEEPHAQPAAQAATQVAQAPPPVQLPPINITQNQYASPTISQRQSARDQTVAPPVLRVPELRFPAQPNIKCLGARIVRLDGDDDAEVLEEQQNGRMVGWIVCFRNQPIAGKQVASAENVAAHIVYKTADGRELTDVSNAAWLGERTDMVDLGVGQTRCVIVFMVGNKRLLSALWKHRKPADDFVGGEVVTTEAKALPSNVGLIEVTVLKEDGASLAPVCFKLEWNGDAPVLEMTT